MREIAGHRETVVGVCERKKRQDRERECERGELVAGVCSRIERECVRDRER